MRGAGAPTSGNERSPKRISRAATQPEDPGRADPGGEVGAALGEEDVVAELGEAGGGVQPGTIRRRACAAGVRNVTSAEEREVAIVGWGRGGGPVPHVPSAADHENHTADRQECDAGATTV